MHSDSFSLSLSLSSLSELFLYHPSYYIISNKWTGAAVSHVLDSVYASNYGFTQWLYALDLIIQFVKVSTTPCVYASCVELLGPTDD